MATTQEYMVTCGNGKIPARLPLDRTRIIPGPPPSAAALPDAAAALRHALEHPVGMPPLRQLVAKGARVTIGIQDGRLPRYHPEDQDLRILGLPVVLELLQQYGARPEDIQIKVANALHRMWTRKEMTHILGPRLPYTLGGRLSCTDAMNPNDYIDLGITKRGMEVQVHRAVLESDLFIFMSAPTSFFAGGWKSILVGMGSWQSIRYHHRPWPFASGHSVQDPKNSSFHKLLNEMGALIDAELERRGHPPVLKIEGVLTTETPQRFAAIDAGRITPVREMHLDLLVSQLVTDVEGQTDVLLVGMPDGDGYSRLSVFNPIHCRNRALSGLFGAYHDHPLVRKDGILIVANPFEPKWSLLNHPSYHALYHDVLPITQDPVEVWDTYSEEYAHRPEFVHKYRNGFAYHGAHPVILYGQGLYALNQLGGAFAAGVPKEHEAAARRVGFEPFPTVDAALREAEARLGKDCSITYHPHLESRNYYARVHVNGTKSGGATP
jgi:lactate racemase-like protein